MNKSEVCERIVKVFCVFLCLLRSTICTICVTGKIGGRICYDGLVRYRYVARVSYDGTAYKGWQQQTQPRIKTLQGTINQNLSKRFSRELRIAGASRTDQGVHAKGQGIHFDVLDHEYIDDIPKFQFKLNQMLPNDIRVYNMTSAPLGTADQVQIGEPFHATKSATAKKYIYRYCTNAFVEPLQRHFYAHFYKSIDYKAFEEALQLFVGTYDFSCFGNRIEQITKDYESKSIEYDTIRTIYSIKLVHEGDGYHRIEFHIKSALYKMIRNIIGTCTSVGKGELSLDDVRELLTNPQGRINNPAMPAVPEGLLLEHVYYDHY